MHGDIQGHVGGHTVVVQVLKVVELFVAKVFDRLHKVVLRFDAPMRALADI